MQLMNKMETCSKVQRVIVSSVNVDTHWTAGTHRQTFTHKQLCMSEQQSSCVSAMSVCAVTRTCETTHNLSFTQKPLEVVFLDVHQAGDVGDIKAVVLHMLGLKVHLRTGNKDLSLDSRKGHSVMCDSAQQEEEPTSSSGCTEEDVGSSSVQPEEEPTSSSGCTEEHMELVTCLQEQDVIWYLVEFFQQPQRREKIVLVKHRHEQRLPSGQHEHHDALVHVDHSGEHAVVHKTPPVVYRIREVGLNRITK